MAKLLIARGANVNASDFEPPLNAAAAAGRPDLVSLLLDSGADVNGRDDEGYTALMEAAGSGYREVAERLIAAGIDVNARNGEGLTALHYARSESQLEIAELLVQAGAQE
ncbi:MAG TPA: ankyrin repeat domain-containing protein [Chthonomonadaceae bacterium]|nr:ankyrin repeat domain-containing protein [Chthonomonadaceae bacterium]